MILGIRRYIADTGSGRVLRMNPDSGQFVRNARHNFTIYSSFSETFEYSMYRLRPVPHPSHAN